MKMTTQSDEKKADGLNINARVFVPNFGASANATNQPGLWATPSGNHSSNAGNYENGVYYPSTAPQATHTSENNAVSAPSYLAGYECDPDAYDDESGAYGYVDENGNFVEVEDESDNGMDSDEEAWMMEQIMKCEDEQDRVHGIVRDEKGNVVNGSDARGDQVQPSAFGAVSQATAQAFARRCIEDESEGSEPEPEFE